MGLFVHPALSQSRLLEFVQAMWFISTQLVLSTEPATEIWGIARCDGTYLRNADELEDWRQELPTNQRVISGSRSTRHGLRLRQRPWRVWAHLWWAVHRSEHSGRQSLVASIAILRAQSVSTVSDISMMLAQIALCCSINNEWDVKTFSVQFSKSSTSSTEYLDPCSASM